MKQQQERVKEYMEENNLRGTTAFRIMDFMAEAGEIVQDAVKSADYGVNEEDLEVKEDEIGDALFSLLAVCNDLEIDAEEAFQKAIQKYEKRIEETGDPGSK
ncbi:MAG: MazG nucleotide pyrophosphohydrolase domain-containing protein [Candidatus Nanohaloarchaea archaeon]